MSADGERNCNSFWGHSPHCDEMLLGRVTVYAMSQVGKYIEYLLCKDLQSRTLQFIFNKFNYPCLDTTCKQNLTNFSFV